MNYILICLIQIVHILLILFVILAPFSSNFKILEWHYGLVFYLLFKWLFKFGKCQLTELEYQLRGIKKEEGFIYSISQPVVEYSPEILKNFVTTDLKADTKKVLVLDNCYVCNNNNIEFIFSNSRHIKCSIILTAQYPLRYRPSLRANIDYIFIFCDPVRKNREKLYDHYGGMFPTFEIFSAVLDKYTKNYGCLVIDNTTRSNRLEDQVFWYKVDLF